MGAIRLRVVLFWMVWCLLTASAVAQETTGTINGRVTDESNAIIPGVGITVTGAAILGERAGVSDEAGTYRFLLLPPGSYTVKYDLPGFRTLIREGIIVEVSRTTTLNVSLGVATVAEAVTVTGESPVVDVQNVNVATSFNQNLLESLPNARDIWSVLRQTPGLQMQRFDVGGSTMGTQTNYRAYGRSGQNWVTLDGVATTENTSGAGVYYDYGSFSEISVSAAGNSADIAVPGVVTNTVIKTGGNVVRGEAYVDWEDDSFQGSNLTDTLKDRGIAVGDKFVRYNDFNANAGGPFVKDKFWWFYGYRDTYSGLQTQLKFNDGTPGAVFTTRLKNYTAKMNYQLNPANQIIFSTQTNTKSQPYRGGQGTSAPNYIMESTEWQEGGPYVTYKFQWTSVISNRATLDISSNMLDSKSSRLTHVQKTPSTDQGTGAVRGGYPDPRVEGRMIWQNYATLAYFADKFIHGSHDFKIGYGYIKGGEYQNREGPPHEAGTPGHVTLRYINGVPDTFTIQDTPVTDKTSYDQNYFFLQDKWQIVPRLTLNLGLRFDRYFGWLPEQGNPGAGPYATRMIYPRRDVAAFQNFVPRFSLVIDLFGNNKTAFKMSYGRFSDNVGTGFTGFVNPVNLKTQRYVWNGTLPVTPELVARSTLQSVSGQVTLPAIDPNLKNALTDEYTAGIEHELVRDLGLSATFVRKFAFNRYATIDRAYPTMLYTPVTAIDPGTDGVVNLASDKRVTIYERTGPVRASDLFYTNHPGGENWTAFDVSLTKRLSNKWQMLGGFEWDRTNGAPPISQDPNQLVWGGRAHFSTWVFKLLGTYELPRGFTVSSTFESQKGAAYVRNVQFNGGGRNILDAAGAVRTNNLAQGSLQLPIDPQGTHFMPNVNLLNVRAEKTFQINDRHSLSGMFDLFNVFNANTIIGVETLSNTVRDRNNQVVPRFGRATTILNPIIFRLGLRYRF